MSLGIVFLPAAGKASWPKSFRAKFVLVVGAAVLFDLLLCGRLRAVERQPPVA